MTCSRRTGETITFDLNEPFPPPRVCHEAVGKINIHIRMCGGSSTLAIPFSISEANMISLMKPDGYGGQVGGEAISDTRIICMEVRMRQDGRSKVDSSRMMDG